MKLDPTLTAALRALLAAHGTQATLGALAYAAEGLVMMADTAASEHAAVEVMRALHLAGSSAARAERAEATLLDGLDVFVETHADFDTDT